VASNIFENEIREIRKRFMLCLFDKTEGDEYRSVSFDQIYKMACYDDDNRNLEIYDSTNDILKDLVKQDLVNNNYVLIDESNDENISITSKGKQDYIKL
jgi:hypothetical protein